MIQSEPRLEAGFIGLGYFMVHEKVIVIQFPQRSSLDVIRESPIVVLSRRTKSVKWRLLLHDFGAGYRTSSFESLISNFSMAGFASPLRSLVPYARFGSQLGAACGGTCHCHCGEYKGGRGSANYRAEESRESGCSASHRYAGDDELDYFRLRRAWCFSANLH